MASGDARPVPYKNTAYRVSFPILDADGDLVSGASGLDSEVSIDGGTFADCTNEATEIATSSGMYYLDLTAAEMNGDTIVVIVKTSSGKATPIVLYPEESGDIRVNTTHISGDSGAADNAEAYFDGTGYAGTNNTTGIVDGGITATKFGTGAITAAALASDAGDEIADKVMDEALSGHTTSGTAGRALGDLSGAITTEAALAAAVLEKIIADHSSVTGSLADYINDIRTVTEALTAAAAALLAASANTMVTATAVTGTLSTTQMSTNLTETTNDHYKNRIVIFRTGALAAQAASITAYNGSTKVITMTTLTEAPANGDTFIIL